MFRYFGRIALVASLLTLAVVSCDEDDTLVSPGNQAPVADAGDYLALLDDDGDGIERAVLDGSGSRDGDGSIVAYSWRENGEPLAAGVSPEVVLPLGEHDITLIVTDDGGRMASDIVRVSIRRAPWLNMPPVVRILAPLEASEHANGATIAFLGSAEDPEEGALPGDRLTWRADGVPIGSGTRLLTDGLSLGQHLIALQARDSEGAQSHASIVIRVRPSFANDVLSFFAWSCVECHGSERAEGGIRLDSYEAITTGGNANGPLIVPGDPTQGILIPQVLSDHLCVGWYACEFSDRFGSAVLPAWIAAGAPDD